jgi:hypothetical protein
MQVELLDRRRWHPPRAGERDVRLPRDLAQPTPPAQRPGLALADEFKTQNKIVAA